MSEYGNAVVANSKDQLIKKSFPIIMIGMSLIFAVSLLRTSSSGWHSHVWQHVTSVIFTLLLLAFRRNLPLPVQAVITITLTFLFGIVGTIYFGLFGWGPLVLFFLILLSTCFYTRLVSLSILAVSTVTLVAIGFGFSSGIIVPFFNDDSYHSSFSIWLVTALLTLILCGYLVFVVDSLQQSISIFASRADRLASLREIINRRLKNRYTKLRVLKKEMSEREEYFRTLFELSADSIILFDLTSLEILDINKVAILNFGFEDKSEIIGRTALDLGIRVADPEFDSRLKNLKLTNKIENIEYAYVRRNVEYIDCLMTAQYVLIQGKDCGICTLRDITKDKLVAAKLKDSELRFRTIYEQSPVGITLVDVNSDVITKMNAAALQLIGYDEIDVIGKSAKDLGLWAIPSQRKDKIQRFSNGEEIDIEEVKYNKRDGATGYALTSIKKMETASENMMIVFGIDITERKNIEKALMESEQEFRKLFLEFKTLLNAITDFLVLSDSAGKIIWYNEAVKRYFEIGKYTLVGTSVYELWNGNSDTSKALYSKAYETSEITEGILKSEPDGVWGVKLFPIEFEIGADNNILMIASDLTEKIAIGKQAARSAHLAALGELSAGIAHEINNPVAVIIKIASILSESWNDIVPLFLKSDECKEQYTGVLPLEEISSSGHELLGEISTAGKKISRIVSDLKTYSSQPQYIELKGASVETIVQRCIRLTQSLIKSSTDNFIVEIPTDIPAIVVDAGRLEQVVINLITNACQALESRTAAINIAVKYDQLRHVVILTVRDKGKGMAPEVLSRVTDPFFTTKRQYGGTGLGLSVSSRIIEELNGRLLFDSTLGEGTTVTIKLPTRSSM